jgi:sec-independent protein translocase protein TatA
VLNGFGWPHLLIIAALIIILFGAKRLPDAARGIGKSMRIFRAETRGMHEEEAAANGAPQQAPPQLSAPFAPPQSYAQQPQQQYAQPQQQYAPPAPQQQYAPPQQPYVAPVADQAPAQGDQQR